MANSFWNDVIIFPNHKGGASVTGISNHWNGIRTGLDWNGMEWNRTIQDSKIMG